MNFLIVINLFIYFINCQATIKEVVVNNSENSSSQREDHEIVNRCARAISSLCESTQRSLWMKWPELCDEIYSIIKPSITDNKIITGEVKASLLNSLISLHSWTRSRVPTTKNSSTQTVKNITL
uniref:DUF7627 domain-containing protein n=1 Tax=Heterorhabditis bacteriophora TaxID=37862 RepID=A0A1I7X772_HETBA